MKGRCGNCGNEDIEYGSIGTTRRDLSLRFTCNKCGKSGKEWHDLVYSETTMDE